MFKRYPWPSPLLSTSSSSFFLLLLLLLPPLVLFFLTRISGESEQFPIQSSWNWAAKMMSIRLLLVAVLCLSIAAGTSLRILSGFFPAVFPAPALLFRFLQWGRCQAFWLQSGFFAILWRVSPPPSHAILTRSFRVAWGSSFSFGFLLRCS